MADSISASMDFVIAGSGEAPEDACDSSDDMLTTDSGSRDNDRDASPAAPPTPIFDAHRVEPREDECTAPADSSREATHRRQTPYRGARIVHPAKVGGVAVRPP